MPQAYFSENITFPMQDSKLVKNLKKLDGKTRQRFKVYVNSPYFNQHKKTKTLLQYIYRHLDKNEQKLDRHLTFQKLFPGEPFSEQLLFNTMSSLKKLLHSFLAQQQYESRPFTEELYLLEYAYYHNQFDLLTNRAKHLDRQLSNYPFRDSDHYHARFRYLNTMAYYQVHHEDRSKTELLQALNDKLDRYYILEKLRHSCQLVTNELLINSQFEFSFLDEVLAYYRKEQDRFSEDLSIHLYYTILMSLREDENPTHYQELKHLLKEKISHFSPREQSDLYSYANNFCVRQINKGYRDFQKELFELYQEGLTNGLIFTNGLLNEWNYKNITVLGCILGEFEWTERFLETYKERLPEKPRENSYNYNMAHLNYSKRNYSEALDHLLLVRFSDVKYHLNYNNLLLATYYALGDTEALISLLDTFRIYVIRNRKMTVDLKKQYTNFLRYAKKLTQIKQLPKSYGGTSKQEKFAALFLQIRQAENMVNRYWLENTCRQEAGTALEELLSEEQSTATK